MAIKKKPFELPEVTEDFGLKAEPDHGRYTKSPFDLPGLPVGEHKDALPATIGRVKMPEILPQKEKQKLLFNHNPKSIKSSKLVLDGFGIDRLLTCYAEGIDDDDICAYLRIRPGVLKSWIASSPVHLNKIQRLNDIMRSKKVNTVLNETLDYKIGTIESEADEFREKMNLTVMKMKTGAALEMDKTSRQKETTEGTKLPVVNLGFQINVGGEEKTSNAEIKPVFPQIPA